MSRLKRFSKIETNIEICEIPIKDESDIESDKTSVKTEPEIYIKNE